MYGWVHKCLKEVVLKLCGEDKWNEIIAKAKVEDDTLSSCNSTTYHEDEEYFSIIKATLEVLPDISEQELYNLYGDHFISYVRENGYEAYLLTFGDTLFELLSNVNKLHIHLAAGSMDKIRIPIIDCERIEEPNSFLLRYSSPRGDRLTCLMVGMVKSVARTYFSTEVTLTELKRQGDAAGSSATVWKVCTKHMLISPLLFCVVSHCFLSAGSGSGEQNWSRSITSRHHNVFCGKVSATLLS